MKVTTWTGCYDNQWRGLIVPEAFAHPAKFSPGLIQRIYRHGIESGYFKPGDVIGDPFGGIGGGGIFAAYAGLHWRGVELEEKFCCLAQENFKLHYTAWLDRGYPIPVLYPGDSRRFSEIVGECAAITTSPPYADQLQCGEYRDPQKCADREKRYLENHPELKDKRPAHLDYGQSPGQIGTLKAGDLAAVITSPPHQDITINKTFKSEEERHIFLEGQRLSHPGRSDAALSKMMDKWTDYGTTPGQIGKLKAGDLRAIVTSPPYADSVNAQSHGIDWTKAGPATGNRKRGPGCKHEETFRAQMAYSDNPANIGRLAAVVTSLKIPDRFWAKVNKSASCWEWTGTKNNRGYGEFWYEGKRWLAHRFSYYAHFRDFDDGKIICHKCDNSACVNPNHLFQGSQSDNLKDCFAKGRAWIQNTPEKQVRNESHGRCKVSDSDIEKIRQMISDDVPLKDIAEKYGLSLGYVYQLKDGQYRTIGNLKVDGIVTSPPYEKANTGGTEIWNKLENKWNRKFTERSKTGGYLANLQGYSPGQIGQEQSETYWTAMRQVYTECHKALKPGGYLIVVVKAYVKNKRRVPLPQQTLKLLINLGFEPIERIKAMLTQSTVQGGLFGADIVKEKARKSFFRRLAEAKGSPRIDWEEVLVVKKCGG